MRGMCGKEEEENRERFNPLERHQRRKENSENQTTILLFEPPLSSIILHCTYTWLSSEQLFQLKKFYSISIPFGFLFNI